MTKIINFLDVYRCVLGFTHQTDRTSTALVRYHTGTFGDHTWVSWAEKDLTQENHSVT